MPSFRPRSAHARSTLVTVLAVVALTALLAAVLAACGGDGIDGTYGMTEGEDAMKDFTLTLDGGDFTLAGPNPMGGEDIEFKGTYTVDGDAISLVMDGEESEVGTIDGDRLEFETIVWTKK
ncbi:MAG TPA: hypothetical protein VLA35_05215 [Thermoleophilia bacterium]|nr:hypothetical protein [Thermoleophilia bacterium]